jgi:phosphoribosylglycinamide formyltransferase 1
MLPRIAIFASGTGTNAENIIHYFQKTKTAEVVLVLSNKPDALVLAKAEKLGVETLVFTKKEFYETEKIIDFLQNKNTDWVVLAGFLWLIPENLIQKFPNQIINIHPALLPKYGGKGMYGMNVHTAIWNAKEPETGITIHLVNPEYDKGEILFQTKTTLSPTDTPEQIAHKIHDLEQKYFPEVIEKKILDINF